MSTSSPSDSTAVLKEVLEALKALQVNQVQLASHVDAISGRVNILAGIKEVTDVAAAAADETPSNTDLTLSKTEKVTSSDETHDHAIPQSPSLPSTGILPGVDVMPVPAAHAPAKSVTSRIILT